MQLQALHQILVSRVATRAAFLVLLGLAACGQKGPLYLPTVTPASPAAAAPLSNLPPAAAPAPSLSTTP